MSLVLSLIMLESTDFYQNSSKFIFMSIILFIIEITCHGNEWLNKYKLR